MAGLPLFIGVWVKSWSRNCPHCIRRRVKSVLGLSSPDIRVELTNLGDGNVDPSVVVLPVDPRGNETPLEGDNHFQLLHQTFEL